MNLHHLRVFLAVARRRSYSRAAGELFISQPTVSLQVKKLEEELGTELFDLLGKKVYLTEAGETLFEYAQKIFTLVSEAQSAMEELSDLQKGRLALGASTTPGIYLLPGVLGGLKKDFPRAAIHLEISNTHKVVEAVMTNRLDLGVVGEEFTVHSELHIVHLLKDELTLITAPDHPLAKTKKARPGRLAKESFIMREQGSSTRKLVEETLRKEFIQPQVVMELDSVEAVKQAVAAGLGISLVSKYAISAELKAGILSAVEVPGLRLKRDINLIYHKDKRLSKLSLKFIDYLKTVIASPQL